ncbi:hypothetical protein COY62_01790 [bacterium (Candidatus Howlettbacteria) CG_4_10_14_0_8_um_filter_40_9]|nr:MAG: hypothetical protein COY62_01790 [bacterium (Candidatus Howlettbacteria) CG_4_10_14_0_8_um_filter_40_9]
MKKLLQIILIAILSLLLNGEYLAHGLSIFQKPELIFFYLIFISFLYFTKKRFRLNYKNLFILGAVVGLLIEGSVTKSLFASQPLVLGINPLAILLQILAWGLMATVIPFYLVEKYKKHQKIEKLLLGLLVVYLLFGVLIKSFFASFVDQAYFLSIFIVSGIIYLKRLIKGSDQDVPISKNLL